MKILHILDHSLPLHSGYTFRSRNIFRCQREAGLEPVAVTSPKHEASWSGPWAAEEEIDGVRYHRSGAVERAGPPFVAERRLMRRLERRLLEVARTERPAVLHAHSPVLNALPALRVGRRLGIPVVYEIRAFWEDAAVDLGHYRQGGLKYRLVRALETRACRRADAVVTICRGLREDLLARGIPDDKVSVVPNAVAVDEFQPVPRDPDLARRWGLDGAFVVGFLGSFYHYEGLDLLLEATARLLSDGAAPPTGHGLPATNPDPQRPTPDASSLTLLLVGGGAMEGALKRRAAGLGLGDRVVFTGRLPHDAMPAMYGLVDVLAFPRKSMRLTELVTPLKPLEAMAMGKPVLASDVGGHRELVADGDTGLLFRADDAAALAERLGELMADEALRRRLARRGGDWVRAERTWASNGPRYLALYRALRRGAGAGER